MVSMRFGIYELKLKINLQGYFWWSFYLNLSEKSPLPFIPFPLNQCWCLLKHQNLNFKRQPLPLLVSIFQISSSSAVELIENYILYSPLDNKEMKMKCFLYCDGFNFAWLSLKTVAQLGLSM